MMFLVFMYMVNKQVPVKHKKKTTNVCMGNINQNKTMIKIRVVVVVVWVGFDMVSVTFHVVGGCGGRVGGCVRL